MVTGFSGCGNRDCRVKRSPRCLGLLAASGQANGKLILDLSPPLKPSCALTVVSSFCIARLTTRKILRNGARLRLR